MKYGFRTPRFQTYLYPTISICINSVNKTQQYYRYYYLGAKNININQNIYEPIDNTSIHQAIKQPHHIDLITNYDQLDKS